MIVYMKAILKMGELMEQEIIRICTNLILDSGGMIKEMVLDLNNLKINLKNTQELS